MYVKCKNTLKYRPPKFWPRNFKTKEYVSNISVSERRVLKRIIVKYGMSC
jgi:hypothetical protein